MLECCWQNGYAKQFFNFPRVAMMQPSLKKNTHIFDSVDFLIFHPN